MSSIQKIQVGNTTYNITASTLASCATAAATAAKVVSLAGFVLSEGVNIPVKFANGNTAQNATLNVNSTGAKSTKSFGSVAAGSVVVFVYDGTNWIATQTPSVSSITVTEDSSTTTSVPIGTITAITITKV